MTPQESSMLEDLVRKVKDTQLTEKDPEAEQLLLEGLDRDPDAIYKLAQTVLVQNLALNQARAQIQQLQQQLQQAQQQTQQQAQPARATSFLGGLLGHRDPAPSAPPQQPQYQPVPYQPSPYQQQAPPSSWQAPSPQYASAPPVYGAPAPSGAGSFLRSAATTAAGVAAGALAFEGIESLMHGFGHGGGGLGGEGFGGGWGGGGFGTGAPAVEETVINNYYDDPNRSGDLGEHRESSSFAEHHEHEASYDDRPDNHAGLQEASYHPDSDKDTDTGKDSDFDRDSDTDSGSDTDSFDDSSTSDFDDSGDFGGGGDDSSFV